MSESNTNSPASWDDDNLAEWTEDQFRRAAILVGGQVVRPADGTLTRPGRPPSANPKQQVTLRLDPEVIAGFRATGKGWQSRINAELRKVLGL